MIMKTLMSESKFNGLEIPIIIRFGQVEKIDRKWKKLGVNFKNNSIRIQVDLVLVSSELNLF